MSGTDTNTIPSYLQELLGNSREALEINKQLQKEIVSLRFTVDRQAGQISALKNIVEETHVGSPDHPSCDILLSRREAAGLLSVNVTTLYRWENSRQLIPTRIGGKVFYNKRKLEEILNQ